MCYFFQNIFKLSVIQIFLVMLLCSLSDSIGLMSRVFTKGPGDQGSIPGRVIPKTQKMVLDAALAL